MNSPYPLAIRDSKIYKKNTKFKSINAFKVWYI